MGALLRNLSLLYACPALNLICYVARLHRNTRALAFPSILVGFPPRPPPFLSLFDSSHKRLSSLCSDPLS